MTDPVDRDLVVARAIALLPVPVHEPGFWDRLDRALDEVDAERIASGTDAPAALATDDDRGGDHRAAPALGEDGRYRFDPPGEMTTRTHLLVVVSTSARHLTASAVTFLVEG